MPERCKTCSHKDRQSIDASIRARTVTMPELSERTGISRASLHRHARAHVPATILSPAFITEDVRPGDLMQELLDILISARRVRQAALLANRGELALRAGAESLKVIEVMLTRLAITDEEVFEEIALSESLALAVGASIRDVPKLGALIADKLREHGHEDVAADIEEYAAHAQRTIEEGKRAS